MILPKEKPSETIGRPVIPYRKVKVFSMSLEQDVSGRSYFPKGHGSGSTCHRRFQEWNILGVFKKTWIKLLKIYDYMIGIDWTWQSIDSISVKSSLGGRKLEIVLQIEANWAQKDIF